MDFGLAEHDGTDPAGALGRGCLGDAVRLLKHEAFRLETLPIYRVDSEAERIEHFLTSQEVSVRAEEAIRVLDLTDRANPGLPDQDFWMFDESRIVYMNYAEDGSQTGRELLEGVDPAPYIEYRSLAMQHSEPLLEFCARIGL